jgi:hypothetical protein
MFPRLKESAVILGSVNISEGTSQLKGIHVVNSLLSKLCQGSGGARTMALRELLESSLFKAPSVLFGAIPENGNRLVQPFTSLLNDNHKQVC